MRSAAMIPSADDTCASCGWPGVPSVMTSPIAEMPGTFVRYERVDHDVALLHLQADALGVEAGGHRPAAGGDEQIVGANLLASCRRRAAPRRRRRRLSRSRP